MIVNTKVICLHEKSNTVFHSGLNTSECQFLFCTLCLRNKMNYYVRSDCFVSLVGVVLVVKVFFLENLQIFLFSN